MVEALLSFNVRADFAIFRDQSITTSHTTYIIPPKTTVVGLVAAILGIDRENIFNSDTIDSIYTKEYIDLFKSVKIGIRVLNKDISKINVFTNNISLKNAGGKPFKKELLVNPNYEIFILAKSEIVDNIRNHISKSEYKYMPFLGNAYCLAKLSNARLREFKDAKTIEGELISTVIIQRGKFTLVPQNDQTNAVAIENHLHFTPPDTRETVNFWIPLGGDKVRIDSYENVDKTIDSKFLELSDTKKEVICVY
jgi:CRISPR-associated protein Cas5h